MFFELLDAKPCRTIMKLLQKVSFESETCEVALKLWFLASGFCLLRLGNPQAAAGGTLEGGAQSQPFKLPYKKPVEIPKAQSPAHLNVHVNEGAKLSLCPPAHRRVATMGVRGRHHSTNQCVRDNPTPVKGALVC